MPKTNKNPPFGLSKLNRTIRTIIFFLSNVIEATLVWALPCEDRIMFNNQIDPIKLICLSFYYVTSLSSAWIKHEAWEALVSKGVPLRERMSIVQRSILPHIPVLRAFGNLAVTRLDLIVEIFILSCWCNWGAIASSVLQTRSKRSLLPAWEFVFPKRTGHISDLSCTAFFSTLQYTHLIVNFMTYATHL